MIAALNADQITAFERDGFLVIKDFADRATCAALRDAAGQLVDGFDPAEVRSVFSTQNHSYAADRYFLDSGDAIRFFLEEGAMAPDGALNRPKHLAINKIGHALHTRAPLFREIASDPRLMRILRHLGQVEPWPVQSMLIFKQPGIGGAVAPHQDATFLHTQPVSVIGLWLALEDAGPDNGGLFAAPGGHRSPLRQRMVREGDGAEARTRFVTADETPLPSYPDDAFYVDIVAPAGSLVALHGLVPHGSTANRADVSRHAFMLHVVDRATRWSADNWIKPA
jgi:phytanoyl-CoA hydroxylase